MICRYVGQPSSYRIVQVGHTSYDKSGPKWLFELDGLSWMPICPGTNGLGVRVSSLLIGQPIVAQALLVLSFLSSQTLLPS
jgi:hypothetical protein